MKRYFITLALFCAASVVAQNRKTVGGIVADQASMKRHGDMMDVKITLGLHDVEANGNRAVLITPRIVGAADSIDLPSVGIYSRKRYYHYLRNNGEMMLSGTDETTIRSKDKPEVQPYQAATPYREWMKDSRLVLVRQDYGCCNGIEDEDRGVILVNSPYVPHFVYVRPQAESVKTRSLSGSAFVDFPVNKTDIRPTYRNNSVELGKILATIDSVRLDTDVRITALTIKGFASPEGSYANNTRLARGRTEALRTYVSRLYDFPKEIITTAYEPENWEGLRRYVERSGMLAHRDGILRLIDSDIEPDAKELKLRNTYPDDYRHLLDVCYPALRRSDYKVEYVVRSFTDIAEIRRLVTTRPQKLSLEEFYLAARDMLPGSDEYNKVFDVAVRMFPDDATANLNAANAAMGCKNLTAAAAYLEKAGDSPQAVYARGVYAALSEDYATAATLFGKAAEAGVAEAGEALREIERINM